MCRYSQRKNLFSEDKTSVKRRKGAKDRFTRAKRDIQFSKDRISRNRRGGTFLLRTRTSVPTKPNLAI